MATAAPAIMYTIKQEKIEMRRAALVNYFSEILPAVSNFLRTMAWPSRIIAFPGNLPNILVGPLSSSMFRAQPSVMWTIHLHFLTQEFLRGMKTTCSAPGGRGVRSSLGSSRPAWRPGSSLRTREVRVLSALSWPPSQTI